MADNKPGYSLVPGDGGRASGLIRRRTAEEEHGSGNGFLDLSLGSIYNNPSSAADGGFSPVARALLPTAAAAPLDASSAVPSVLAAASAAYAPPVPANRASAFALGLAASAVPGDGNGGGHVLVRASKALAVANPVSLLPPLFASDGSCAVPVPVPVHGNAMDASDSGATPVPRSKGAVALLGASPPSSVPLPPNRKSPRGRRGNATGCRRRSGAAGDDADAADAAPTTGGENAPPPFPWATNTAGAHPTLDELIERGISFVEGEVRCKRCDAGKTISYEIRAKFEEMSRFIVRNVEAMHDRAPAEWMYPALPDCDKCGQKNSLRPVIAADKWRINWMFLLLGQTLGLCTLEQLKHFCARTRQHRTGAKDRVLYSTYMELCNQLCPGGPFDMASERKNRTRPFA
ncbi:unnamed protein product [Miscanthus lutarioriparius]|uniref:DUF7086 domain-containing protein n=1 Tax=Miscanthus lutarioriparius TaxID=422564 RepID=A0A811RLJ8_9POAL|nr:unnamed protein product [Miscanthus lutarioriparius]